MKDLRYPIGEYTPPNPIRAEDIAHWIADLDSLPDLLERAVAGLSEQQLDTPYRAEGWTLRQVVHHVADSHMNAFIRFRLALTEASPTIKPYFEDRWARLPDYAGPPAVSLMLIRALHGRWVLLLRGMAAADFERTYFHPEYQASYRLDHVLGMYAWHGRHHVAHITSCRGRAGG